MKSITYIFFLLLTASYSFGQTPEDILEKVNENYNKLKAVQLQMNYKLFKGYLSNEIVHQYIGEYANNREVSYRKVSDAEFIHFKNYAIKINHQEKVLVISDAIDMGAFDIDFKETLKVCKDIKLLEKRNGITEIALFIEDMNEIPYSQVRFKIDEQFWVQNMTFYYATQSNFGSYFEQDLDFPRLEITYENVKNQAKILDQIVLENYINIVEDKIYPTAPYSSYEIMDLRKK